MPRGECDEPAGELHDLTLRYGSLTTVDRVNLTVRRGARHALIGPNGAGKSSLFTVVAGSTPATSGRVVFNGQDVSNLGEARRGGPEPVWCVPSSTPACSLG